MLPNQTTLEPLVAGLQEPFAHSWAFLKTLCDLLHKINQTSPDAPAMTYKTGWACGLGDRVVPAVVVIRFATTIERKIPLEQAKVVYLALTGRVPVFGEH